MRPYIPTDILMRETPELQKSVAADLNVPDPAPSNIIATKSKKSTKQSANSSDGSVATSESAAKYDTGTGSIDDNASVESSS